MSGDFGCRGSTAERLYGYSAEEALGQKITHLCTDPRDYAMGAHVIQQTAHGKSWTGNFPVKNKRGDRFLVVATLSPFCDDAGTIVGAMVVSCDCRAFKREKVVMKERHYSEPNSSLSRVKTDYTGAGCHPLKPLRVAIASKIYNLVSPITCDFGFWHISLCFLTA